MDYDNPAAGGGGWGQDDHSDFTDSEKSGKDKKEKILLGSSKKKDKEKKKEKEKETKYNQLGAESSNDEEDVKGSGKSKKKALKFGLAKKDKKDKKDKESKEKESDNKDSKETKKKEKKDKPKLKLKKSHKTDSDTDKTSGKTEATNFPPIFGVALETAVERSKCHDGVKLPLVVRECVHYIEQEGLTVEGIYRSSGVKSKITKLKAAYNNRQVVKLASYEPAVVASLFKLFLRELPEPVLTARLGPRFEEVAQQRTAADQRQGLISLLAELPECNRVLVQWVFVHMGHVIANEKMNKMTLQNVSIVLSPTMRISHRVLNCIFEHHAAVFSSVKLSRYIPPIRGPLDPSQLPDSPHAIQLEMRKQESLLAELHAEMSSGVAVSKAREEQLWEQQRIVTQLKRNLRQAKSGKTSAPAAEQDYEEELNFALQTPAVLPQPAAAPPPAAPAVAKEVSPLAPPPEWSPEEAGQQSSEHRVTVQVHRHTEQPEHGGVTVVHLNQAPAPAPAPAPAQAPLQPPPPAAKVLPSPPVEVTSAVSVVTPAVSVSTPAVPLSTPAVSVCTPAVSVSTLASSTPAVSVSTPAVTMSTPMMSAASVSSVPSLPSTGHKPGTDQVDSSRDQSEGEAALELTQTSPNSTQQFASQVVSFSSPILSTRAISGPGGQQQQSKIPLLPPPPASSKPKLRQERTSSRPPPGAAAAGLLPPENKLKSKSLPRGLPSDGTAFDNIDSSNDTTEDNNNVTAKAIEDKNKSNEREALIMEEMKLKFEYEELMTLKSELERKKRTERREIAELQEEIATMQTLYQYRTYSVDSSEEESEEGELADTRDQRAARLQLLNQLARDKRQLEEKKVALQLRLAEERESCLRLRVSIRLEQERIKRQKLSQFPGIGFGKLNLMD